MLEKNANFLFSRSDFLANIRKITTNFFNASLLDFSKYLFGLDFV